MTDRKQPGVAFWGAVVLVVILFGYPLSFGPACWISNYWQPSGQIVSVAYRPIIRAWFYGPGWFRRALESYVAVGANVSDINANPQGIIKINFHQPSD